MNNAERPDRPRLLDLFSCEGGAGLGYHRAGFDVYSIDLDPKFVKRNPFPFRADDALLALEALIRGDALTFSHKDGDTAALTLADFSAIHASPPCQGYSVATAGVPEIRARHPRLIEPVRDLLAASGLPYIIENVVGAPLSSPLMLCGTMFGLRAIDDDGTPLRLERHRLFESNVALLAPQGCFHDKTVPVGGVYGGGRSNRWEAKHVRRGGYTPAKHVRAALIGVEVEHMTLHGLSQSIPPAYTAHIGTQLLAHLESLAVAA